MLSIRTLSNRRSACRILLVARGFVAPPEGGAPPAPAGEVIVEGRLRRSQVRRTGALSDPGAGTLTEALRVDIPRLEDSLIGREAVLTRSQQRPRALRLMVGDHCQIDVE